MRGDTQLVEAVCVAALNLQDPAQRKIFLDRACGHDERLREAINAMLADIIAADEFFPTVASNTRDIDREAAVTIRETGDELCLDDEPDEQSRQYIGRYKLLQKIGEGGCGTVYMAEQHEPVRRLVALKVIKLGMDTKAVVARFEAERQALAMMDHPNIARVLDAGATESGRPYFVMELVRGVKITNYCDENKLNNHERLALFIQICRAIQHAHQKGIIHRDIKPSNVLVTLHDGAPVPKVIDFGIAKATEGRLTDNTVFTALQQFVGTPAYMSPEQAEMSGLDVDTRSDIYSLGVLLYELLTGKTPFDTKILMASGLDELRRTLREKEPPAPSTMITSLGDTELTSTAVFRHAEPPKLISSLKGDLDWIVMKSLEKDRTRRYETANGLAMDVQRYLENEPVVARPPSQVYRLRKLVRRNKGVFASAAAVLVVLLMGLGSSTWLFFKERESRLEAERGRANEVKLRQHAQAREKIAKAWSLIAENKLDQADQMVLEIPDLGIVFDGAPVYRVLGEYSAVRGQWKRAAERFNLLWRLDQMEPKDFSSLDCTRYAVTLLEIGDRQRYEEFRGEIMKRFAGSPDPLSAERAVKNCLLLPAGRNVLDALAPFTEIAEKSTKRRPATSLSDSWRCSSAALFEYRREHWNESIEWCRYTLNFDDKNNARVAMVHAILAMDYYQAGQLEDAQSELDKSRELISSKFKKGLDIGDGKQGFWFDWIAGRIFLKEAETLIEADDALSAMVSLQASGNQHLP
jgi:serine/threonine protein kinase